MAAPFLTRLGNGIEKGWLTAFHYSNRPLQRRAQILRISNRPLGIPAHAFREHRVIDIWIDDCGADAGILDAALVPVGHALNMHDLLMVGAVIAHDREKRNAMVCGGPEHA